MRMTSPGIAVGDLLARDEDDEAAEKPTTARMMCSIMTIVMPSPLSRSSTSRISSTSDVRQPGHGLVGEQHFRLRRERPRELEPAHLDLRERARRRLVRWSRSPTAGEDVHRPS